jgi:hypothetical protein
VLGLARINRARLDTGVRENIGKNKRCFHVFPGVSRVCEIWSESWCVFVGSCWAFIWEGAPNDFHAKHIWFPYRKLPFKSNDRRINMLVISLHQMVISRVEATSGAIETLRFDWENTAVLRHMAAAIFLGRPGWTVGEWLVFYVPRMLMEIQHSYGWSNKVRWCTKLIQTE